MKIFLVGMPGSGKSTIGRQLAAALMLDFIDLDILIEERAGKTVQQIFGEKGEDYFRQLESQELLERAGSAQSFVMATGGGAPCHYDGMDVIRNNGLSIFIDVPVEELMIRVSHRTDRPLLNTSEQDEVETRLRKMFDARLPIYSQAHIILKNPTLVDLMKAIQLRT